MIPLTLTLACGTVLYCISQYIYRSTSRRYEAKSLGCEPIVSYPHLDPLWGLDLSVQLWREFHRGELSEGMRKRHETFGHTFNTKNLGQDCVYTIDPDNIHAVTTDNFEDYGKSGWVQEGSKHVGAGILMNDGEAWKQSRATLKGIFARTAIDEPTLVEPHFQQLTEVIRENGGSFDFQEVAARFTLDLVTDFLFGKSTETLPGGKDADAANYFLSLIKKFEPSAGTFIAVGALAWLELLPSYRQIIDVVNGMKRFFRAQLDFIISDSESPTRLAGPSCFRMMEHEGVDIGQIQAELQNIFFASFDTTTGLISNIIDILSRRQDVQLLLREEISYLKSIPPTRQDLGKMEFLRFVFLEGKL
jgi:cytochrome P450